MSDDEHDATGEVVVIGPAEPTNREMAHHAAWAVFCALVLSLAMVGFRDWLGKFDRSVDRLGTLIRRRWL